MSRFKVFHAYFVLLALVIHVSMSGLLRLLLVLKESIVQHLVIDLNFAHLRLHTLPHFLLQRLGIVCLASLLTKLADSGLLNEVWQLEGYFVDTALVLEIATLLRPVSGNRHGIPDLLAFKEEERVFRCDIPSFN